MSNFYIGSDDIKKMYVNGVEAKKAYYNGTQLYPSTPAVTYTIYATLTGCSITGKTFPYVIPSSEHNVTLPVDIPIDNLNYAYKVLDHLSIGTSQGSHDIFDWDFVNDSENIYKKSNVEFLHSSYRRDITLVNYKQYWVDTYCDFVYNTGNLTEVEFSLTGVKGQSVRKSFFPSEIGFGISDNILKDFYDNNIVVHNTDTETTGSIYAFIHCRVAFKFKGQNSYTEKTVTFRVSSFLGTATIIDEGRTTTRATLTIGINSSGEFELVWNLGRSVAYSDLNCYVKIVSIVLV